MNWEREVPPKSAIRSQKAGVSSYYDNMSYRSFPGAATARTGRILVCDDERTTVRLIQAQMERYGHAVTPSFNGLDALQWLENESFDLMILDVTMPGIDGFELLKHLRREPRTAQLPVIMLTGRTQDEDVFNGYHCGADVYLTKPVDFGELAVFVRSLISD